MIGTHNAQKSCFLILSLTNTFKEAHTHLRKVTHNEINCQNTFNTNIISLQAIETMGLFRSKHRETEIPRPETQNDTTFEKQSFLITTANNDEQSNVMCRLKTATIICFVFFILEITGGLIAHSLAVLSDAAHLFADLAGFCVAVLVAYMSRWSPTSRFNFGFQRAEALAALFSMSSLMAVTFFLAVEAIKRGHLMYREHQTGEKLLEDVDGKIMSIIAGIGVVVNLTLACILGEHHVHLPGFDGHDHSHEHSHPHSGSNEDPNSEEYTTSCHDHSNCQHNHDHTHDHLHAITLNSLKLLRTLRNESIFGKKQEDERVGIVEMSVDPQVGLSDDKTTPLLGISNDDIESNLPKEENPEENKNKNLNLHAAYIHVLTDLLQSVIVLISGLIIEHKPSWQAVDPICTILFSFLVFKSAFGVVKTSAKVLMNTVPSNIDWYEVHQQISSVESISKVHNLQIWSISSDSAAMSMHAEAVDPQNAIPLINAICSRFGIIHTTIQLKSAQSVPARQTKQKARRKVEICLPVLGQCVPAS